MAKPSEPNRNKKYDPKKPHITDEPITSANWYKHVNWLNTYLIVGIPIMGLIAAYWTPLQFKTAVFAVVYYFMTGLGITAGMCNLPSIRWCFVVFTNVPQVTTDYGHILHTARRHRSRSSLLLLVVVLLKVLSDGGLETIVPITDIPIPTKTHTPFARVSCIRTSAGWS
jgi:hypothetical protein